MAGTTEEAEVAIVGGGASGIVALKECIEYGLKPMVFEKTNGFGGLWRYEPDAQQKSSLMSNLITNTTKEMMCFSDFPFPFEAPVLLHHTQVYSYFQDYVKHFDLLKYFRFNNAVIKIKKSVGFKLNGCWDVLIKDDTGSVSSRTFKNVIVCDGMYTTPFLPDVENIENFKGQVIHSKDFRTPDVFRGKKVLVIGSMNSAGDCATEVANTASQTYISSRKGFCILPKFQRDLIPTDAKYTSRAKVALRYILPQSLLKWYLRHEMNVYVNHSRLGCAPDVLNPFHQTIINDHIAQQILCGRIKVVPGLEKVTGPNSVKMTDGTEIGDLDAIIFATGYQETALDILDDNIVPVVDGYMKLYMRIFPVPEETESGRHSFALIGRIRAGGGIPPVAEMQARLAVAVMAGKTKLPTIPEMKSSIVERERKICEFFHGIEPVKLFIDPIPYMNEIASLLNCKPNYGKMLVTDPALWYKVVFGPCTPYQWRLTGPHHWPGARDAIMSFDERMTASYKTSFTKT